MEGINFKVDYTDGHPHYVQMKAGKMYRNGNWVYPDLRKGYLYIYRNSESLMHFCWKERKNTKTEDNFIIFPGDCTYTRVEQCQTGRVYLLKFNNSPMRMFYWLQEPKTNKDEDHCKRINYLLNHNPSNNISQYQLSQLFSPEIAEAVATLLNKKNSLINDNTNNNNQSIDRHDTTPISGTSSNIDNILPNDDNENDENDDVAGDEDDEDEGNDGDIEDN